MSKRTFHYIKELAWLLLALLPLFVYLAIARASGQSLENFMTVMSEKLNFINTENVIYTSIKSVFGDGGTLPIMNDGLIMYATYFCIIELVHLIVDVLLFIPRLAQSWIEGFERKVS